MDSEERCFIDGLETLSCNRDKIYSGVQPLNIFPPINLDNYKNVTCDIPTVISNVSQNHVQADYVEQSSMKLTNIPSNLCKMRQKLKNKSVSRQENKLNRNSNKRYFNYKGIEINPKQFIDYHCTCIKKCSLKLSISDRKAEFEKFWALSEYDAQTAYIAAKVSEHPVKKRYGRTDTSKKDFSRVYSLCSSTVCRDMFCKTLQISSGRINTVLTKIRKKTYIQDQRGIRKTNSEMFHSKLKNKNVNDQITNTLCIEKQINICNKYKLDISDDHSLKKDDIYGNIANVTDNQTENFVCNIETMNSFSKGELKKGTKRKFVQSRIENKLNRNTNKPYVNYKGILIEPKKFIDYICGCCKICHQNISTIERLSEFQKFWTLPYNSQTAYIVAAVSEQPVKKQYSQQNYSKKDYSRKYALGSIIVCREMFCKTLHISPGRINTALRKYRTNCMLSDQRGRKQGGHNKLPMEIRNSVMRFFKRIPVYKSHFHKDKSKAKFLPSDLTLTKLYELYREEEKSNTVSNAYFKKLFYSYFSIRSKELCYVCQNLKNDLKKEQNNAGKIQIQQKYNYHQSYAEKFQKHLEHDMLLAKRYSEIECLTLDIHRTLPLPQISNNLMCFKRLLWVYNVSIHSSKKDQGYCYMWPENVAGKGAQEIGSCIVKHFKEEIVWSPEISHVILWTDSYRGLNRNIKMTLFLRVLLQSYPNLKSIKIKYLFSGHCSLPNHKDFSDIERALKSQNNFYLPDNYVNVIRYCRKKKPLTVKLLNSQEFLSTEQLEQHVCNNIDIMEKYPLKWSDFQEISLYSHEPFILYYKTDFDSESLSLSHFTTSNNQNVILNSLHMLTPLWPLGKPLSQAKIKDLKSLLHMIPLNAKSFYLNLKCGSNCDEDIDGLNNDLDFNIEYQR